MLNQLMMLKLSVSGQAEHDPTAHDQTYPDIESLIYNVQVEAENQRRMNNELKKQNALIHRELETCKERAQDFEKKPVQFINYKSRYEKLQNQISIEKQTIEKLKKEKDEIQDQFLKARDEYLNIKNETKSFKKAFKMREDKYLDDIFTLGEKLKSHEQVVFKMLHSLQTIHMLGTKPNSFYDLHMKTGLGYQNPKRLKKAIKAQPKMYNGKNLKYTQFTINLPDSKETLVDAEKIRLKMKDKMIQLDYAKLNKLYESFVHQKEISADQTYLSPHSTSNVSPESSPQNSSLPPKKMPQESQLLKLFVSLEKEIQNLDKLVYINLHIDADTKFIYDNKSDIQRIFNMEVLLISKSLQSCTKNEIKKILKDFKDIQANLVKQIKILEIDFQRSQAQSIDLELQLQHQKEKNACDIYWKSKLAKLNDENASLVFQVKSLLKERENIKLEYQTLFNSIRMTRAQHQWEVN
ncbi:hypothetical protein Tco_0214158 [Tanacetum coccineum]